LDSAAHGDSAGRGPENARANYGETSYNKQRAIGLGGVMPYFEFLWTDEIVEHLAEHGVNPDDFERVVMQPLWVGVSRSSDRPCCWGETADGRRLFCVYEYLDDVTIVPVTAYELSD
jgi:hypothetical protein